MFDYLKMSMREPLRASLPAEKLCPVMRLMPANEEIEAEVSNPAAGSHILDVLEHIYVTIFEHPLPGYCPYPTLTAGKNQAVMNSALRTLSNDKDDYVRAFANSVLAAFKSMKSFHDFKLPVNETKTVINRLNLTAIIQHPIILDAIFAVYGNTKTSYNTGDDKYLPVPNMFDDVSRITIPYSDINVGNRALPPYWRLIQGIVSNTPKDVSYENLIPIYGDLMTLLAYSARPLSPLIMLDTRRDCAITYSVLNVLAAELIGAVSGVGKSIKNGRRAYDLFLPCYGDVGDGAYAAEALAPLLNAVFNDNDGRFLSILMETHKNEGRYFYACYGILDSFIVRIRTSCPSRSINWDILDEPISVVALEAAKTKSDKKSTKGKKKASDEDDLDLEALDEPEADEADLDDDFEEEEFEADMSGEGLDADDDADGEDNDEDDIEGDTSEEGETDFDPDLDGDDDMPEDSESSDDDLSEDDGSDDTTSMGDDPDASTGLTMEGEGEDTPDDESNTIDDPFTDEGSEDSSEDPTAEGDDDLGSDDLQEGSEDDLGGEGELADDGMSDDAIQGDPTDNSIAPPAPAHNDIGPISLDRSKEGLGTYLYKRSLLAACIKLLKSEDHGLTPEQVSYLEEWCVRWLFIASVKETKAVVKSLGLTSVLR